VERILGKQRYSAVYQADAGIFPVKDQAPESRDDLKPKLQKQEVDSFLCMLVEIGKHSLVRSYSTRNIH
jgi:hypothetical protein